MGDGLPAALGFGPLSLLDFKVEMNPMRMPVGGGVECFPYIREMFNSLDDTFKVIFLSLVQITIQM